LTSKKIVMIGIVAIAVILSVYIDQSFQKQELSMNTISGKEDPYVKEYSMPAGSAPDGLVVDNAGLVWVASKNATLYSVYPSSGQVKNYEIKSGAILGNAGNSTMVWAIVQDSDGKIWLASLGTTSIWRFDPTSSTFDSYLSKTGAPFQMKVGNDGKIWFTTLRGDTAGVIEKSQNNSYKISAFDVGSHTNPAGIFLQNDSIWVAGVGSQNILQYKVNQENDSVKGISIIQSIPKDNVTLFSTPTDLLVYNNILWLTEHGTSFLTSYDITSGKVTRYPTAQNGFHTITLPFWIRGAHDPKVLWFNEHQGNKIGRFDLANKTLTEYDIPSLPKDGYLTYPLNISQDPHDEKILWFSEWNTDKIGMINGHITIPFDLSLNTTQITLEHGKTGVVDLEIKGDANLSGRLYLNASSSITSTAELGNLEVKFSSNDVDVSHDGTVQLFVNGDKVAPGNYTVGISASDGFVTKTKFLDLSVQNK
jgi:streptogramin lyase